ncbi:MAG: hypothetical protein Q7T70_19190 [Polaromonas sp.]|nr:hypothetical protein [Polaromonas sp.]
MNKQTKAVHRTAVAACLALTLALAGAPVLGATDKAKKASPAKQGSTKFVPGSQETKKERSTRLQRECKGQVNAGACTGHTQ